MTPSSKKSTAAPMRNIECIIPNYNSSFWLKKTLSTLAEFWLDQTHHDVVVTVVDNNSEDDSVKMIKKDFPWVKLINLPSNVGFAKANNVALKETTADYVLLLNSDMELTAQSNFDVLVEYLESSNDVSIIGPKVVFMTGELDHACHRGEPTPWAALTYFLGLERLFPTTKLFGQYHLGYKDLDTVHDIDATTGAAMMVRSTAMKKVGLLDEQFFMYAEDLDWCKRFREAGYRIIYHPQVSIIHHKNKSGIKSSSQQIARKTRLYFYDTMLQYYDKHYRHQYPQVVRELIRYLVVMKKGAV